MKLLSYVHLRNIYRSTGAGRVARQLTEHLAARDDVDLHVLADRHDYDRVIDQVGAPWTGFRYHFFERDTSRQQMRWYLLGRPSAEAFWTEAEVVHCAAESYVPTRRARLAVTVHDAAFFEPDGAAHRGGWVQRAKWRLLYRRLAKRADLFHTVSHFSAARLAHHVPAIADRLRVVHNAVTPLFFAPTTAAGQAYLDAEGLASRPFVLLPRGLHYRKNADLVLEAWPAVQQQHPDVRLVVTSHNDPAYVARARARFGDDVVITDFISDDALHALYGAACVTWMPSRYEGFGLPVLESMARGTPVVASDSSSLPEVAGEAALLVPPTDADAHVQALEALLRDPALRDDLRARGRARAEQFTWRRAADDMYAHFQTLL